MQSFKKKWETTEENRRWREKNKADKKKSCRLNFSREKADYQLDKGIEKLEQDLDVVNFLQMIKGYNVLKQVMFSHDDRFFLHF